MVKLGDHSEKVQHMAVDDIVSALFQTWADLRIWIYMNPPHNAKKSKKKSKKSKK